MLPDVISPLLIALSLVLGDAVVAGGPIQLRDVSVPSALATRGYTPAVIRGRIEIAMERLRRDAALPENRSLVLQSGDSAGEVLAQELKVAPMLRYLQAQLGTVDHEVSGDIVLRPEEGYAMRLVVRAQARTIVASFTRPGGEEEALFEDAGFAIVRAIDPVTACAAVLHRADPAAAESCLEAAPRQADPARLALLRRAIRDASQLAAAPG